MFACKERHRVLSEERGTVEADISFNKRVEQQTAGRISNCPCVQAGPLYLCVFPNKPSVRSPGLKNAFLVTIVKELIAFVKEAGAFFVCDCRFLKTVRSLLT